MFSLKSSFLPTILVVGLSLQGCNLLWPEVEIAEPCRVHLPEGIPTGTAASNDLICRDIYVISSNDETKFADWVAYRLDPSNLEDKGKTKRVWKADPDIDPAETLEPDDYKGAHDALKTDRGHLAPLGSFKGKNWEQVNYLSNITPQNSNLNRGEWRLLEEYVRDLVLEKGEVYVITGTFYDENEPYAELPGADEPHVIPSGFWKIVMYDQVMETYLFPQEFDGSLTFRDAETSLAQIEEYSGLGLDFLGDRYEEIDF